MASVMPLAIFIGGVHNSTDPMRKAGTAGATSPSPTRYAGVLPVPGSSSIASNSPNRLDSLLDSHRDARAERGRVLYGEGHERKAAAPTKTHRRQCADHVASARAGGTAPNS